MSAAELERPRSRLRAGGRRGSRSACARSPHACCTSAVSSSPSPAASTVRPASALAVRALGPERVFALILPERDSSDDSRRAREHPRRASRHPRRNRRHRPDAGRHRLLRALAMRPSQDAARVRRRLEDEDRHRRRHRGPRSITSSWSRRSPDGVIRRAPPRARPSTCRSSRRPTSSSASARRSSTSTPTASTTPWSERRTGWSTTRDSS